MLQRVFRRLVSTMLVLWVASLIAFVILNAAPGDAAQALIGENASESQLQALREAMGLDRPLLARYAGYLSGVLRGDLGESLISGRPVAQLVGERFVSTLILSAAAALIASVLGLLAGLWAAAHQGSWAELGLMSLMALMLSVPGFVLALLFTLVFSLKLRLLPVAGGGSLAHMVLPALTLAVPMLAMVARLSRSSVLDAARADYVLTAHGKGAPERTVWNRHILKNAVIPVMTIVGLHFGHLLGGAFVVETIYGWPGLGRLIVQAVFDKDYPLILGAVLLLAVIYQLFNLLVDIGQGLLDPRVGGEAV
ncbi:MAG: ABC transporter permease [Chloroflexi bacterium]|nr:ABC transporter permease [Chloroflexota bacterium]